MRAENDKLVWLLAASDLRDHVCGFDWAANLAGDTQIRPYRMPGGEQASDSLSIFARHQHLRDAVDFSGKRIRMPVKNVMLARGDERDRFRLAIDGGGDNRRCFCIFGEEVVPGLQHYRM